MMAHLDPLFLYQLKNGFNFGPPLKELFRSAHGGSVGRASYWGSKGC